MGWGSALLGDELHMLGGAILFFEFGKDISDAGFWGRLDDK